MKSDAFADTPPHPQPLPISTNNYIATDPLNLTGNIYAQTIIGNAGANHILGGGGTDLLIGLGGNDIYHIDVAATQVVEYEGGGNDAVYVATSYILGSGEVETLSANNYSSTQAINLTGNVYSQILIGNAGKNILHGGGGIDTLIGLGGDDIYYVDVVGTQTYEAAGAGLDAVYASVSFALAAGSEVETLSSNDYGATIAINLTGNGSAQSVIGNAGANALDGGGGADTLLGLGGADTFRFTTALGGGNIDAIADFSVVDDTIALDDAIFTAIGAPGALNPNAFVTGSAAADADDRIVYNSATGQLFYDADGSGGGAAVQFATLASGLTLTASDFQVI